jgi:hypothetical protein
MAITDQALMDDVLCAVESVTSMAILHREAAVASHVVESDVDLCISGHPVQVMAGVARDLAAARGYLVLAWNYDRGSYSFFFSRPDATSGAQIDVVSDDRGRGRYGVRSGAMLASTVPGARWPRVSPMDEALYELRKSQVKGDIARVVEARNTVDALGNRGGIERARVIFSRPAQAAVVAALSDNSARHRTVPPMWLSRLMRPSRLVRRCGFWAVVLDRGLENEARQAVSRFENVLVGARMVAEPSRTCLVRTLWRPLLLVSTARPRLSPRPDVVLEGGAERDLASRLVHCMYLRELDRLDRSRLAG